MKINANPSRSIITLGLSVHRPEMVLVTGDLMAQHEAVFLEEPPANGLYEMLDGKLPLDDYLIPLDVEYPAFSRDMCRLLKDLKDKGKAIFQIEPFLEALMGIHDIFADGHGPTDLDKQSLAYPVYLAEKKATGALLNYYRTVIRGTFEQTLESVIRFARLDAARFRFRDSIRAQVLAPLVCRYPSAYIEAGMMHYSIWRLLRQHLPHHKDLELKFLDEIVLAKSNLKGRLYAPVDQLTLLYVFHPKLKGTGRELLLAGRTLIYAKLITKLEMAVDSGGMPHLKDEFKCIQMVSRLSISACRELFSIIRGTTSKEARWVIKGLLGRFFTWWKRPLKTAVSRPTALCMRIMKRWRVYTGRS
jgi:hypothetical protein